MVALFTALTASTSAATAATNAATTTLPARHHTNIAMLKLVKYISLLHIVERSTCSIIDVEELGIYHLADVFISQVTINDLID